MIVYNAVGFVLFYLFIIFGIALHESGRSHIGLAATFQMPPLERVPQIV